MNLDEQLRAALNLEAEMRTAPPLDTEGLISGGQSRRRRRNATVAVGGLLAVVLVSGGIYGVAQLGGDPDADRAPDVATEPSEDAALPSYLPQGGGALEPGTYRKRVGSHDDGNGTRGGPRLRGRDWLPGSDPVMEPGRSETNWGGIAVFRPLAFARADGCGDWSGGSRTAGRTTDRVARQVATLPSATVLQAPSATVAFGHEAVHVRVRVDDSTCPSVYNWAADTLGSGHSLSYYYDFERENRQAVVDALVVDVDGTPIVAALFHHSDATPEVVAEITSARDSISIVPSDEL